MFPTGVVLYSLFDTDHVVAGFADVSASGTELMNQLLFVYDLKQQTAPGKVLSRIFH
jgi:hypothetical protein